MDDERPDVLTIGRLAHRTGLPVRTLRFWSDEGAVPPVGRSAGGYRLYDAESVARVELVRTLRELGLGLDDVCRVLSGRTTVAGVAEAHVAALDAQIRSLKVSRAVLSTVAKRGSTVEETALMNRLARLSAAERKQIIDEFKEEVFGGLDHPRLGDRMRTFSIELPDDPTPEQVDAWIELAELVRDPGFRARLRTWMELNTPIPGQGRPPGASIWWARQIVQTVAEVRKGGVAPEGPAAAEVLSELFGGKPIRPPCCVAWRPGSRRERSTTAGSSPVCAGRIRRPTPPRSWNGWRGLCALRTRSDLVLDLGTGHAADLAVPLDRDELIAYGPRRPTTAPPGWGRRRGPEADPKQPGVVRTVRVRPVPPAGPLRITARNACPA
ncbi:UNVERIFIED_CONTAM: DNA-binding transcriptional MerR regulator [Streptomyces canus]